MEMHLRSILLYACETWPIVIEEQARLERTDHAMIRWICSVRLADRLPLTDLRQRLNLDSISDVLRWSRLRWFGHLHRMDDDTWPKKVTNINVNGAQPRGRPKKRWSDCIEADLKKLKLKKDLALKRGNLRAAIKPQCARDMGRTVQPSISGKNAR